MKQLVIVFLGLIAHFDLANNHERAVLVNDGHHKAVMVILVSDLPHPEQVEKFAGGQKDSTGRWAYWTLENSKHLIFKNIPGGSTKVDTSIPHLMQITDGSEPLLNIKNGVKHSHVSAYVDYKGGQLTAGGSGCPIKWTPPEPPVNGCTPTATFHDGLATPVVGFFADTSTGDPYILNRVRGKNDERLDLSANAVVWIGNVSKPKIAGEHHKGYLGLLTNGKCINGMTGSCPEFKPEKPLFSTVADLAPTHKSKILLPSKFFGPRDLGTIECTDSHFP